MPGKREIKAKVTSRDSAEASEATSDTNKTCTEEEGFRGRSQFRGFFREHSAGVTLPPLPRASKRHTERRTASSGATRLVSWQK